MEDRMKIIRQAVGLTQAEFADKINISRNYIALIETGRREPSDRTIYDICRVFRVSEEWLRTGNGEMFLPKSRTQQVDEIAKAAGTRDPQEAARFLHGLLDGMSDADILLMYDFFLRHFPPDK